MWERGCPSLEGCDLTSPDKSGECSLYQSCCQNTIGGCQRVVNGIVRQTVLLIPCTRSPVEFWHEHRMCALQKVAQCVSEELMIAIPAPLIIQRNEEEI